MKESETIYQHSQQVNDDDTALVNSAESTQNLYGDKNFGNGIRELLDALETSFRTFRIRRLCCDAKIVTKRLTVVRPSLSNFKWVEKTIQLRAHLIIVSTIDTAPSRYIFGWSMLSKQLDLY